VRTALLDLDGTLVDSAALITEHLAGALAAIGVDVPAPEVLRTLVGPPFETALPAIGLSAEQTTAAIAAYRVTYDKVAATHTPIYPGVRDMLERLRAAGVRLALATSKPEHLARRMVAGVGVDGFLALVGGADDTVGRVGKDKVIASVLERLELDPAREPVVMVGDRHHDVDGAAAHGIPAIGVEWGYAAPGELAGAALVVPDVAALEKALLDGSVWSARTDVAE
jgi:phosphoglycolate phosphatase